MCKRCGKPVANIRSIGRKKLKKEESFVWEDLIENTRATTWAKLKQNKQSERFKKLDKIKKEKENLNENKRLKVNATGKFNSLPIFN